MIPEALKKILLLSFVLLSIISGCTYVDMKSRVVFPVSVQLKVGGGSYAIDLTTSISMDSVLEDSRCPEEAICIWTGNAEVRFKLTASQGELPFTLNTNRPFDTERIIRGYRIKLVRLTPYPNIHNSIKHGDYKAEVLISKM